MPRVVCIDSQSEHDHLGMVCSVQHEVGGSEGVEAVRLLESTDLGASTLYNLAQGTSWNLNWFTWK